MRILLLSIAVCLTGCATKLTVTSPPIPSDLRVRCGDVIAQPLTTGDQYDLARALNEAVRYGKDCRARMGALVDAVDTREQVMNSLKKQIEGNK